MQTRPACELWQRSRNIRLPRCQSVCHQRRQEHHPFQWLSNLAIGLADRQRRHSLGRRPCCLTPHRATDPIQSLLPYFQAHQNIRRLQSLGKTVRPVHYLRRTRLWPARPCAREFLSPQRQRRQLPHRYLSTDAQPRCPPPTGCRDQQQTQLNHRPSLARAEILGRATFRQNDRYGGSR